MLPLLAVVAAILSTLLIWKGTGWLESSTDALATYYHIPAVVQGAILAAVGSSFPELSTVVLSTLLHDTFDLGVAAIVGSAIFNILVIPGISGLVAEHSALETNRDLVYKEAQFYMVSIATLLLTFSLAAIYSPVEGTTHIEGRVGRLLALLPIAFYGLYLFLQYQDTVDHEPETEEHDIQSLREWSMLAGSLVLIVVGVEGLVRTSVWLGDYFDTPDAFWGATVVAAGTSVPDAFVSARTARDGRPIVSIANVLGSNVFDLLVAIPAGILIAGASVVDYSIAAPMMGVLIVATVVLLTFLRTDMILSTVEAIALLVMYGVFITWMLLETVGPLNALF
jgi:cation:H+ antiporter